jgi:glucose/arabinose dehydrogenase
VRWYTKGHRNPQGITFRPGSTVPYEAEHGPNIDDEVNALPNGGNGGWNPTNGTDYDQTKPMTDLNRYPSAFKPVWRSGTPANPGTYAPSGITFVTGPQWKSWSGHIMMAFLKNSELRVLFLTGYGTGAGQKIVPGSQKGVRLRVPVQGPDGKVYVATDADPGAIWQITAS